MPKTIKIKLISQYYNNLLARHLELIKQENLLIENTIDQAFKKMMKSM